MCGRFALATEKKILEMLYDLELRVEFKPRYNIAPSQEILALRQSPGNGPRELVYLKWGFVPFWSDDPAIGNRMINARAETAPEKPSFRSAFKKRRLLIPVSGFYEWKQEKGGKQPYYICQKEGQPFSLAGLWERWDRGEQVLETCTILTTEPNELVEPLHSRMPVIISKNNYGGGLEQATEQSSLVELLKPYPPEDFIAYPVSRKVNSPGNDAPELIKP